MDSSPFTIVEHVIPAQHIREYARATASSDSPLDLVVKQYTPRDNYDPQAGNITIIATHGSGLPKELYEPLWEELYRNSQQQNFRIRSIWFADVVHQGASGIRNEQNLGNDPSWFDHSRDLLAMVNHFRKDMIRPIVGIGHSMGAGQLILTSLMHPRLFTSLVLFEPVMDICINTCQGPALTAVSTARRDLWDSREAATKAAQKSYPKWDKRVLQRWLQYGYRNLPTVIYPEEIPVSSTSKGEALGSDTSFDLYGWCQDRWPEGGFRPSISSPSKGETPESDTSFDLYGWCQDRWPEGGLRPSLIENEKTYDGPVTLATSKHQEVFSYLRPNFKGYTSNSNDAFESLTSTAQMVTEKTVSSQAIDDNDRTQFADILGPPGTTAPFYRAEPIIAHLALPHIRPSVLYVFGEKSPLSVPNLREAKLSRTGIGIGGSGGVKAARVKGVVLAKSGHLVPMEDVDGCAEATSSWLGSVAEKWKADEAMFLAKWEGKSAKKKAMVSKEWVEKVKSLL